MRIPARSKFLAIFRAMACSIAIAALLPLANPVSAAETTSTQTKHHEKSHKATHKKAASSRTKSKTSAHKTTHHTKTAHHKTTHHTTAHSRRTAHRRHLTVRQRRLQQARRRRLLRERRRYHHRRLTARELARSRSLHKAFVASSQLRPMAQQLAMLRSTAAYNGVTAYAHAHSGEAGSAAWLALGHAYLLDHKYPQAVAALKSAAREGTSLDDYAAYLTAQAYLQNNQLADAQPILGTFIKRFPDSVFDPQIPVLQANAFIQQGDPQSSLAVLRAHRTESIANKSDYQLALAKANLMAGNAAEAQRLFTHIYLTFPLSSEATEARKQLASSGAITSLSAKERSRRADALYAAHRYSDAEEEYRSLSAQSSLSASERNRMLVAVAACEWKLNKLSLRDLEHLPDTSDEAGARRLYLMMELARDKNDTSTQQSILTQMESRFPTSPWLAEALYSSGNMYLLRKDYPNAIRYYSDLATFFPSSCDQHHRGPCSNYTPYVHWRAAWLTYRSGNYTQAAKMFDDQIKNYGEGPEAASALYWRARIYADQEHNPTMAAKYYRTVDRVYPHYYYGDLALQRLADMGLTPDDDPTGSDELDGLEPQDIPELSDDIPDQDPHLVKARLLANAGLNEYISPEIQAADGSDQWGSLAEAQIYASYGENWRAMRFMKRALPYYVSAPITALPLAYWRILFPQPYWNTIKKCAAANGLDPYMVASLIRQESEFNPSVISYANAWGLMQLLPRVGRSLAHQAGIHHFETRNLLDPEVNIRLGCIYLKQLLDKFRDHPEYAFAAYNAGDSRVTDWQSDGKYSGMDEFVESIPFTQTRDYVEAIVRNEIIYRQLDKAETAQAHATAQNSESKPTPKSTGRQSN
ncbi:MAG: transglycosylase SLT domain-containing protein [Acidobacteriaceae bacterium]